MFADAACLGLREGEVPWVGLNSPGTGHGGAGGRGVVGHAPSKPFPPGNGYMPGRLGEGGGWTGGAGGGSCVRRSLRGLSRAGQPAALCSRPCLSAEAPGAGVAGVGAHPPRPQAYKDTVNFGSNSYPFTSPTPLLPPKGRGRVTPAQRAWEVGGGGSRLWAPAQVAPPRMTLLGHPHSRGRGDGASFHLILL